MRISTTTIIAAAVSISLTACSSTPVKELNQELVKKVPNINLNGSFSVDDGEANLEPFLVIPDSGQSLVDTSETYFNREFDARIFEFNAQTLFPAYDTSRFKCDTTINECDSIIEKAEASVFWSVNNFSSGYGDTYEERLENEGVSLSEAGTIGVMGAVFFPVTIAMGTLTAAGSAINLAQNGSVVYDKEVEFDHDKFYEYAHNAVIKAHGSIENYIEYMVDASEELSVYQQNIATAKSNYSGDIKEIKSGFEELGLTSQTLLSLNCEIAIPSTRSANTNSNQRTEVHRNCVNSEYNSFVSDMKEELSNIKAGSLARQKKDFERLQSIESYKTFIRNYSEKDFGSLVPNAQKKLKSLLIAKQKIDFDNVDSLESARSFKRKYINNDIANLLNKNETNLKRYYNEKKDEVVRKINQFRSSLNIGTMTHCGRIIQKRDTMYEVSLTARLSGYPDTQWLHIDDLFPASYGCLNRNGNVSPKINPFKSI